MSAMIVYARYGAEGVEGIHLGGGAFEQEVDWAPDLFAQADPRFLAYDEQRDSITLATDEGVALYRVIESDGRVLKTVLEMVF